MVTLQRTKNYQEMKLRNKQWEMKRQKREREVRSHHVRDVCQWGWYMQWSIPTLLVFAVIAVGIVFACYYCMDFIQTQLSTLV